MESRHRDILDRWLDINTTRFLMIKKKSTGRRITVKIGRRFIGTAWYRLKHF